MQSRVTKWGNSLGVRIPRTMAERLHMAEGTPIDVVQRDNEIVIRRKQYRLAELLDQVTVEKTHSEIDWGKPMGRETYMVNDTPYCPKRGDLVWMMFDTRVGHEQSGRRPAMVVSPTV